MPTTRGYALLTQAVEMEVADFSRPRGPPARCASRSLARARAKIGLQNLAYNMRCLVTLDRMAAA
jgi:hypothetical protein